ncbi:MAG TPA: HAD family hydrolase [Bryobacteraceae bacterium]|nr:HAD family hydrolase [Bryobacteraceae bacterium]
MKRRAVFLDRDGVINAPAPPGDYIRRPDEFRLLPNIADWIRLFNALDLLVIVVTNQRGVALGRMTAADVDDIHRRMREELAAVGARIDDVFSCPHEEGTCDCRKPRPGLVYQARDRWNLDLAASLMIGDSERDRELARACGMRFVRVAAGRIVEVTEPR